jgi:hypothetical protein
LKAKHIKHHSPAAVAKPRNENCRNPITSLIYNANHWLNRVFAQPIDGLADLGWELVRHFYFQTGLFRGWGRQFLKEAAPTFMMPLPPGIGILNALFR